MKTHKQDNERAREKGRLNRKQEQRGEMKRNWITVKKQKNGGRRWRKEEKIYDESTGMMKSEDTCWCGGN